MRFSSLCALPLVLASALPAATPAQAQNSFDCTCYASITRPMRIDGGSEGLVCPRTEMPGRMSMPMPTTERVFLSGGDPIIADCILTPTGYQPPGTVPIERGSSISEDEGSPGGGRLLN